MDVYIRYFDKYCINKVMDELNMSSGDAFEKEKSFQWLEVALNMIFINFAGSY